MSAPFATDGEPLSWPTGEGAVTGTPQPSGVVPLSSRERGRGVRSRGVRSQTLHDRRLLNVNVPVGEHVVHREVERRDHDERDGLGDDSLHGKQV